MTDITLPALERAWVTTLIVSSVLIATFAVFGMWEHSAYKQELTRALGLDIWNAPI